MPRTASFPLKTAPLCTGGAWNLMQCLHDFVAQHRDEPSEWVDCDFGHHGVRTVDPSVRSCRMWKGFVPSISLAVEDVIRRDSMFWKGGHVQFAHPALMRYEPGGHFQPHTDRDRPLTNDPQYADWRGWHQLGTILVIGYSPDASGGALQCGQETLAPIQPTDGSFHDDEYRWFGVFIRHGDEHEVTRLEAGERIVYQTTVYGASEEWDASVVAERFHSRCEPVIED